MVYRSESMSCFSHPVVPDATCSRRRGNPKVGFAKKPVSKTPASAPSEDVLDDFPAPPKGKPPAKLMV